MSRNLSSKEQNDGWASLPCYRVLESAIAMGAEFSPGWLV